MGVVMSEIGHIVVSGRENEGSGCENSATQGTAKGRRSYRKREACHRCDAMGRCAYGRAVSWLV